MASGNSATFAVSGACIPGAILAVLEEQVGGIWFFRDSSVVSGGAGGAGIGFSDLCTIISGGGVALLEPGLTGNCFCPAQLTRVLINGPATVNEGSSAAYYGTAFFDQWLCAQFHELPLVHLQHQQVSHHHERPPDCRQHHLQHAHFNRFLLLLSRVQSSTNKPVTILNLPPPTLAGSASLSNGKFQFALQGVPGRQHIIEAATNLNAPVVWSALVTNVTSQAGSLIFTDSVATNFSRRFYRAREN